MAKFNFSRIFAGFMNCKRHKIKILSPLGKRADPRASRICQILSPLGFFDSSASRICSRIPLGMTLGSPRFLSRTPLVSLSDTLVRPSDARWDLENPRGLKSAEMEPCSQDCAAQRFESVPPKSIYSSTRGNGRSFQSPYTLVNTRRSLAN